MTFWKKKPWIDSEIRNWDRIAAGLNGGGGGGLTLYGPYTAVVAGSGEAIPPGNYEEDYEITDLVDANGTNVIFPSNTSAKLLFAGVGLNSSSDAAINSVSTPQYDEDSESWVCPMTVVNTSDSENIFGGGFVSFYSSDEFPPAGE